MTDNFADILIIGGGVAGLAAAQQLAAQGRSIILLEGRDRLGGRIDTRHDPAWPLPIERGAEFLHGKPPESWQIAQEPGCAVYDVAGSHRIFSHGRVQKQDDFFGEVEEALGLLKKPRTDMSFNECLRRYGRHIGPEVQQWARMYVEGFNAADAGQVSCAWLQEEQEASDEIEGDLLFRMVRGYDQVVQFLGKDFGKAVRTELSTVVHRIEWGGGRIKVHASATHRGKTTQRQFEAGKILVTVPLGILQAEPPHAGAIAFEPPLPQKTTAAIGQLRMGTVMKIILRFDEPFWEKRLPDLGFLHGTRDFATWWSTLPLRTPVLTGWAGGPAADALSALSQADILAGAMRSLSQPFQMTAGKIRAHLAAFEIANWKHDPLARGAYSYAAAGGIRASRTLSRPIEGKLFFAGEHTHPGMTGTVAGAIASGRRAAGQMARRNGSAD